MKWSDLHKQSTELSFKAAQLRAFNRSDAEGIYAQAAEFELKALDLVPLEKERTRGILSVSAASLLYKGRAFDRAEQFALQTLNGRVPDEFRSQLQAILQATWNQAAKLETDRKFLPGEVIISISGGEVVTGGAPLDLIVNKVKTVQSLFYRTVEYLSNMPLRRRGAPIREIQDYCRPWLFQAPAGSYQFAVAVEGPKQQDMFKTQIQPRDVTDRFLDIVQASAAGAEENFEALVKDEEYRDAFAKLTRNLSPSGRSAQKIRIYSYDNPKEINLGMDAREQAKSLMPSMKVLESEASKDEICGVLRALDLDRSWLEVDINGRHHRVTNLESALDDVIGPLVNKDVRVVVLRRGRRLEFIDIEEA